MEALKIPVALKGAKLVSPDDCASGRACGAVCLQCQEPLLKRSGPKHRAHFSHLPDSNQSCHLETIIHLAAKVILSQARTIRVPKENSKNILLDYPEILNEVWEKLLHYYAKEGDLSQSRDLIISKAEVEKPLIQKSSEGVITPDVLLTLTKGPPLAIEVYVSHRDFENKSRRYRQANRAALEIDIHNYQEFYQDQPFSVEKFQKALLEDTSSKTWLSSPQSIQAQRHLESLVKIIEGLPYYECLCLAYQNLPYQKLETKALAFWIALGHKIGNWGEKGKSQVIVSYNKNNPQEVELHILTPQMLERQWLIRDSKFPLDPKESQNSASNKTLIEPDSQSPWVFRFVEPNKKPQLGVLAICQRCEGLFTLKAQDIGKDPDQCPCGGKVIACHQSPLSQGELRHRPDSKKLKNVLKVFFDSITVGPPMGQNPIETNTVKNLKESLSELSKILEKEPEQTRPILKILESLDKIKRKASQNKPLSPLDLKRLGSQLRQLGTKSPLSMGNIIMSQWQTVSYLLEAYLIISKKLETPCERLELDALDAARKLLKKSCQARN